MPRRAHLRFGTTEDIEPWMHLCQPPKCFSEAQAALLRGIRLEALPKCPRSSVPEAQCGGGGLVGRPAAAWRGPAVPLVQRHHGLSHQ